MAYLEPDRDVTSKPRTWKLFEDDVREKLGRHVVVEFMKDCYGKGAAKRSARCAPYAPGPSSLG